MSARTLILGTMIAVAGIETGSARAQGSQDPSVRGGLLSLTQPLVLAGSDVGFRVVRMDGSIPVGQIVVRINGAWVAAEAVK
jgi:hypothetical protein